MKPECLLRVGIWLGKLQVIGRLCTHIFQRLWFRFYNYFFFFVFCSHPFFRLFSLHRHRQTSLIWFLNVCLFVLFCFMFTTLFLRFVYNVTVSATARHNTTRGWRNTLSHFFRIWSISAQVDRDDPPLCSESAQQSALLAVTYFETVAVPKSLGIAYLR